MHVPLKGLTKSLEKQDVQYSSTLLSDIPMEHSYIYVCADILWTIVHLDQGLYEFVLLKDLL